MKEVVIQFLSKELKIPQKEVSNLVEIPPNDEIGDYAFPCFSLSKKLKKNPMLIAEEITKNLRKKLPLEISNVDFKGAYVNFFIDKKRMVKSVFKKFEKVRKVKRGKKVVIEFSQPNTHKAFHVGHIRGTSIGESLARIFEFQGDRVIRLNYSGDSGMHIAKWIWCYKKYHSKEKLKEDESWIASIYVDAIKRLEGNEKFQEEVEEINKKLETKEDKEINELWKKTRKVSINSWNKIYSELNTSFDGHYFEGDLELDAKKIAEDLVRKKIAKRDDAIFMDFKKEGMGAWVLLRRDGTVLYSAKDIALAYKKAKDYPADRYLVSVGDEQKMHFQQLVKTLELMKFSKADVYDFLAFGMVRFPEGKMSSRTGKNILYSDFSKDVCEIAKKGLLKRGYSGKDLEKRALKIAIAAIKYSMLKQDPKKVMIFDSKEAVSFEGDTGPYLLYSYARASSIVRKVKSKKSLKIFDLKDSEIRLVKKIEDFEAIVKRAYDSLAPNLIANYSFELAHLFNEFYHDCQVIGSIEEGFRLKLVDIFRVTLKNSLDLLGIEVLEEM